MKDIKIVVSEYNKTNVIAAKEFQKYYSLVTGKVLEITDKEGDYDIVAIGNESNNDYIMRLYFDLKIERFELKYGGDDFLIRSRNVDGHRVLFLAGARPRATLYAVYHYFEKFAGVRYFWDGERIPHAEELPLEGIEVYENPRFKYRGQRYFSHRGLHRFQMEHWSLEDWKKEVDWFLKKKLNLMHVGGSLDLFQRVFPDVVSYESSETEEFGEGYENRKPFWPLKFVGKMKEQLYEYMHDRDLLTVEITGTETHWNNKTPQEFIDKYKPTFFEQTKESGYSDTRALVWDIRDNRNFELYCDLTRGRVNNFGSSGIFSNVGFAERMFSYDKEKNMRMKFYCYHKFFEFIQREYPCSKYIIAGWDLWFKFEPDEIKKLLESFDEQSVIFMDYCSDCYCENNITKWNVIGGKYEYFYGHFHAFEMNNDIRGNYRLSRERLLAVVNDPKCVGYVFWPECSHSDTFMLEYYPQNAWSPLEYSMDGYLDKYCADRYGEKSAYMREVWKKFFPAVELMHWSMDDTRPAIMTIEYFLLINWRYKIDKIGLYHDKLPAFITMRENLISIIDDLKDLTDTDDELLKRDVFDIIKTVMGRYIHYSLEQCKDYYALAVRNNDYTKVFEILYICREMVVKLGEFLGCRDEFTLADSLRKLAEVHPIPDNFEYVLKDNSYNGYCRSYIFEMFRDLYLKEYDMFLDNLKKTVETGVKAEVDLKYEKEEIFQKFLNKPLKEMAPVRKDVKNILEESMNVMRKMLAY